MNNVYFGSDWHFSKFVHQTRSMKYNYVRSKDILSKYKKMIKNENDIFIFLGDLSYIGKKNTKNINECLEQIKYLPGKKILVKGNHDASSDKMYRQLGFNYVTDKLEIGKCIFTHKPDEITGEQINIHGHIHGSETYLYVESYNHADVYTGQFYNYPIKLEPLLYNGRYIDKIMVNDEYINQLKRDINKFVEEL